MSRPFVLSFTVLLIPAVVACGGSSTLDTGPGGDVPIVPDGQGGTDDQPLPDATDIPSTPETEMPVGQDVAVETAADVTDPPDPGTSEVTAGGCEGCNTGTLEGLTCAPDGQTAVPDVKVWVETLDCSGQTVILEAISDATGTYVLENVPCGLQTVHMEKGSFSHQFAVFVEQGMTTLASSNDRCFAANAAKIGVITGDWDNIEYALDKLKLDYDWIDGTSGEWGGGDQAYQLLHNSNQLNKYDVVFINCSPTNSEIMDSSVAANLKSFVKKGGSLYLSDYAFVYFEETWPQYVDFPGDPYVVDGWQTAKGTIVDPPLIAYLGGLGNELIDLKYDLGPLVKADSIAAQTLLHVEAWFNEFNDTLPVMMSFNPEPPDGGRVIYTTFHNSEQAANLAKLASIVNYLVFLL